jgi:ribosome biogenesis GTPase
MDGQRTLCHFRGKKNEVVVGDWVNWSASEDAGIIESVQARSNLFYRSDEMRTKSFAANIDQIVVWVASDPDFSEDQISRALISAASQQIPALIALNKSDLTQAYQKALIKLKHYPAMGYEVIGLSLREDPSLPSALLERLRNKVSFIMGPSGAGKSSLINRLIPDAAVLTGEVSKALQSGKHTTTSTCLYWMSNDRTSALIDSPGFQEFGLRHIKAQDLSTLMPDIAAHATGCKFYNCSHLHEPGCVVREKVDTELLSATRYKIYANLFEELSKSNYG